MCESLQNKVKNTTAILNDKLRKSLVGGYIDITFRVQRIGPRFVAKVLDGIKSFDDFKSSDNKRNSGYLSVEGKEIFWRINCYDPVARCLSKDCSDPGAASRLLEIMFAGEWED